MGNPDEMANVQTPFLLETQGRCCGDSVTHDTSVQGRCHICQFTGSAGSSDQLRGKADEISETGTGGRGAAGKKFSWTFVDGSFQIDASSEPRTRGSIVGKSTFGAIDDHTSPAFDKKQKINTRETRIRRRWADTTR